jgi:hypothetical protein
VTKRFEAFGRNHGKTVEQDPGSNREFVGGSEKLR